MYLLPFIAYRLLKDTRDYLAIGLIGLIFVFFNSATFMVGIVLIISISSFKKFIHSRKKIKFSMVVILVLILTICLIAFGFLDISILTERINAIILAMHRSDPAGIMNASAIVWLNGWSQAYETFLETYGLGLGFNQMGCGDFVGIGRFSEHIRFWTHGVVLNWNDGSFAASKLVSEFGLVGIGIVFYLLLRSCHAIFSYITVKQGNVYYQFNIHAMRAAGGICLLILIFIRANGYFLEAVILDLSLLFLGYQASSAKNNVPNIMSDKSIYLTSELQK